MMIGEIVLRVMGSSIGLGLVGMSIWFCTKFLSEGTTVIVSLGVSGVGIAIGMFIFLWASGILDYISDRDRCNQ